MKNLVCLLVFLSLCINVFGHAKLDTPTAWNPNPSKTFPCGGGAPQPFASIVWQGGSLQSLIWEVVAGDGVGPVEGLINTQAQTNFDTGVVTLFTGGNSPSLGQHIMTFTVPNIQCVGPNQTCLLQVSSSSGWVACSTISISNTSRSISEKNVCVYGTEIQFCSFRNAANISIPLGTSASSVDLQVNSTYNTNINNPNVFTNGGDANCQAAYKQLACLDGLPDCGQTSACKTVCQNAVTLCGLTPAEANLYDCSTYPACEGLGHMESPSVFLAALLTMLAVFYRLA